MSSMSSVTMSADESLKDPNNKHVTVPTNNLRMSRAARKKQRRDNKASKNKLQEVLRKKCGLLLPFELIAEILGYSTTPKDVLSLARTCKYFCDTLVAPSANFIWKRARQASRPFALPDPTPNFTEASFAAFIFDGGMCEICQQFTALPYISFSIRLRVCADFECREEVKSRLVHHDPPSNPSRPPGPPFYMWLPCTESDLTLDTDMSSLRYWPTAQRVYRQTDINTASQEHQRFLKEIPSRQEYIQKHKPERERFHRIMTLAVELAKWTRIRDELDISNRKRNKEFTERRATREGWTRVDLLSTPAYGALYIRRNHDLEEIKDIDYRAICSTVGEQMTKMFEHRKRTVEEQTYRERRAEVEKYYAQLKSQGSGLLPPLVDFRRLPVISLIESRQSPANAPLAKQSKKSPLLAHLIQADINRWRENARAGFTRILGFPDWKASGNVNVLHPLDRLTAWFMCTKCDDPSKVHRDYEDLLDFRKACVHRCPKASKKDVWCIEQFVRDEKCIAAAKKMFQVLRIDEQDVSSHMVKASCTWIFCLSCQPGVILRPPQVIGHSRRHDNMDMAFVSKDDRPAMSSHRPELGLCANLMAQSKEAAGRRELSVYGCRYCELLTYPNLSAGSSSGATSSSSGAAASEKSELARKDDGKKTKYFTFNGLRSHVKASHGIDVLRDEDFYCNHQLQSSHQNTSLNDEGNVDQ